MGLAPSYLLLLLLAFVCLSMNQPLLFYLPSHQFLYCLTFFQIIFSNMSDNSNTSNSDAGQTAPGAVVHWVWDDSAPVWEAPEKDEILAPSVGPDVPGREVSLPLRILFRRLLHFLSFQANFNVHAADFVPGAVNHPSPNRLSDADPGPAPVSPDRALFALGPLDTTPPRLVCILQILLSSF